MFYFGCFYLIISVFFWWVIVEKIPTIGSASVPHKMVRVILSFIIFYLIFKYCVHGWLTNSKFIWIWVLCVCLFACFERRGWPETANTWEPLENLQACSDFIEAFEERYVIFYCQGLVFLVF